MDLKLKRPGVYSTAFFGDDDGEWESREEGDWIFGLKKHGYTWQMIPSMHRQNEGRTYSIDGATEQNTGFRKALEEIVKSYPEVKEFLLSFDGPLISASSLLDLPTARLQDLSFLHGTSAAAWERISKEGLRARGSTGQRAAYGAVIDPEKAGRTDAVYLTTQLTMARSAARQAAKAHKSSQVILRVSGWGLDPSLAVADEDSGESTAEASIGRMGSFGYLGHIDPENIQLEWAEEAARPNPSLPPLNVSSIDKVAGILAKQMLDGSMIAERMFNVRKADGKRKKVWINVLARSSKGPARLPGTLFGVSASHHDPSDEKDVWDKTPVVTIILNEDVLRRYLETDPLRTATLLRRDLRVILLHELTHAAEPRLTDARYSKSEFDPISYYRDPQEVRARVREIADAILRSKPKEVLKGYREAEAEGYVGTAVEFLADTTEQWRHMRPYLEPEAEKRALQMIDRALRDKKIDISGRGALPNPRSGPVYVIGRMVVRQRASVYGGGKPVLDFVPDLRYGIFKTNLAAKVHYMRMLNKDLADAPDEFVKRHFDARSRNIQDVKVLKLSEEQLAAGRFARLHEMMSSDPVSALERIPAVVGIVKRNPSPNVLSRREVAQILAEQPGNRNKDPERLSERWIASDRFTLTTVHAFLPDLGITAGKTGESQTSGPIIVDKNIQQVARAEGNFGAAPDFLVLDGQNRVVSARRGGPRSVLQAFVGDKVIVQLRRKDDAFADRYKNLQSTIDEFLNTSSMPGGLLIQLREYVRLGVLTQEELNELRGQWRTKYKSNPTMNSEYLSKVKGKRVNPKSDPLSAILRSSAQWDEMMSPNKYDWTLYENVPIKLLKPSSREEYLAVRPDKYEEDGVPTQVERYDEIAELHRSGADRWPVVVDQYGDILDGFHRLAVMSDAGDETVNVIQAVPRASPNPTEDFDRSESERGLRGHDR